MATTLEKIYNSGLRFLTPLSLEETYKLIIKEGIRLVKADHGSVLLEQNGELKRVYASSPEFYKIKPRKRGFMFGVFQSHRPKILSIKSVVKIHPQVKSLNIRSDLIVPISNHNKTIGVLSFMSQQENFFSKKALLLYNM